MRYEYQLTGQRHFIAHFDFVGDNHLPSLIGPNKMLKKCPQQIPIEYAVINIFAQTTNNNAD